MTRMDDFAARAIRAMESFPGVLELLLAPLDAGSAAWRPADGAWSITEIAGHLADEESEDFRARLRLTLESPETPWPPISPAERVAERNHRAGDLQALLVRFAQERAASVEWLRGLGALDWRQEHREEGFPPMRAGDLLASWRAHDAAHLRQIGQRLFQLAEHEADGFSIAYAT